MLCTLPWAWTAYAAAVTASLSPTVTSNLTLYTYHRSSLIKWGHRYSLWQINTTDVLYICICGKTAIKIVWLLLRPWEGCTVLWWVCLCVCVCDCLLTYLENHTAVLRQFLCMLAVVCGPGWVLLRRHCDTLCTSGFVNDIMCSHIGQHGASCVFLSGERLA